MIRRIGILAGGVLLALAVIWGGTGGGLFATAAPEAEGWVGSPLDQHAKVVGNEKCLGWVDLNEVNPDNKAETTLVGWAWDTEASTVPKAVLLVNVNDTVVAVAEVEIFRPDVRKAVSNVISDQTGWRGVAEASPEKINAYALLASGEACPLGRTQ